MKKHNTLTLYVEGGNRDSRAALIECQRAFKLFLERAGLPSRSFSVEACASRRQAYEDFRFALESGENALLLVDSEDLVDQDRQTGKPVAAWQHLAGRQVDTLTRPEQATADQAHLMVPTMEAWLIADRQQLAGYYKGKFNREAFNETAIPNRDDVEQLSKADVNRALENATRSNKTKGIYHKGNHSFEILETLRPQEVAKHSYHLRRLLCHLRTILMATINWLDCSEFAPE